MGPVTADPAGKLAAIGREAVSLRRRVSGRAAVTLGAGSVEVEATGWAGGGAGTAEVVNEAGVGLVRFLAGWIGFEGIDGGVGGILRLRDFAEAAVGAMVGLDGVGLLEGGGRKRSSSHPEL